MGYYEANELEVMLKTMNTHIFAIQGNKHNMTVGELRIYLNTLEREVQSLKRTFQSAEAGDMVQ